MKSQSYFLPNKTIVIENDAIIKSLADAQLDAVECDHVSAEVKKLIRMCYK